MTKIQQIFAPNWSRSLLISFAAAAAAAVAAPVENHMEIAIEFELKNGGGHDASLTEPFFIKTDC